MDLEEKISGLIVKLKDSGNKILASAVEKNWNKTALFYSQELNTYSPLQPMEPEMERAFEKELKRIEVENPERVLESIKRRRIIQTAPHLGATENPRMLAINWLSSLGLPDDEFYVVGMYSGIPFSNNFRPGRINRKVDPVNLFPSNMQDTLVFRSKVPEKTIQAVKILPEKLRKLLPIAKVGDSYTKWALGACANIEREILGMENLVYLDINEVVANYLEEVKDKYDHPLNRLKEIQSLFPDEALFHKDDPTCPGLVLTFLSLAFLNHFKCFGSFRQVGYLSDFKRKLAELEFLKEYKIEKVPTANLTTGEFALRPYPVDIIEGEEFAPDSEMLFGTLIVNMMTKEWLELHI